MIFVQQVSIPLLDTHTQHIYAKIYNQPVRNKKQKNLIEMLMIIIEKTVTSKQKKRGKIPVKIIRSALLYCNHHHDEHKHKQTSNDRTNKLY